MAIHTIFFDLGNTLVRAPNAWVPGAQDLLSTLRQGGYRLGIISNTPGLSTRQAILAILPPDFDLTAFDESLVLFSSEIGKSKPSKGIE